MPSQQERRENTRRKLLDSAHQLFSERGTLRVSGEDIVQHAGLTRGALYHHFGGKEGLFLALYQEVLAGSLRGVAAQADADHSPLEAMLLEGKRFLHTVLDPATRQIVYLDAPQVLPPEVQRRVDEQHGIASNRRALEALQTLEPDLIEPLAHALFGVYNELARWVALAEEPHAALEVAERAHQRLLEGLGKSRD